VIHDAGLTYNDIKPENIMVSNDCQVTLIDFGFADEYIKDGLRVDSAEKLANFQGNILFSSQDQMNFFKTIPKDDIISVFYMLIYLLSGNQFIGERKYMEELKGALEEDACNKKYFHYIRNYKSDFQIYEIANFLKYYMKLVPDT
jgi:serine/threonine protein kinase